MFTQDTVFVNEHYMIPPNSRFSQSDVQPSEIKPTLVRIDWRVGGAWSTRHWERTTTHSVIQFIYYNIFFLSSARVTDPADTRYRRSPRAEIDRQPVETEARSEWGPAVAPVGGVRFARLPGTGRDIGPQPFPIQDGTPP